MHYIFDLLGYLFDVICKWFFVVLHGDAQTIVLRPTQIQNKSFWGTSCSACASDCSLRQGAGGTEFAHFGSRTCFLRWFYRRSQAYFGQKPEEHGFSIKNVVWRSKTTMFDENTLLKRNVCVFLNLSRSSRARAGPIWARKIKKNM